ncbi:MAG TPA: hypothetical protein ENO30_01765, partial [Thermodesulfobium narugense]|nr:hypothetical protein [Thermodesulfobium narugense]
MGSYENYYAETVEKQADVFVNEYYFKELSKVKVSSQEAVERNISKIRLGRAKIRKAVSKTLFFQEYIIKKITQIINSEEDGENVLLRPSENMEDLFHNLIKLCKLHKDAKIYYKVQKTDNSLQHRIQYAKAVSRFNRVIKGVDINPIVYEKVSTSLIETVRLRKKHTIEAEKIKNYLQSHMVDPNLPDTNNVKPDILNKIAEYQNTRKEVDRLNEL